MAGQPKQASVIKRDSREHGKPGYVLGHKKSRVSESISHSVTQSKRHGQRKWDEEIDSDDGDDDDNSVGVSQKLSNSFYLEDEDALSNDEYRKKEVTDEDAAFESVDETPEEARIRVAKQFLERLQSDGDVVERLKREADVSVRKVHYYVADKISASQPQLLRGHKASVTCVAVGEYDTTKVFTGSKDCCILQWDLTTQQKTVLEGKKKQFKCGGHFERVLDLAVSNDGQTVISVGEDRIVRVWDPRASTTSCQASLYGHSGRITGVVMEPTLAGGRRFYTISDDKSLKLWNLETQTCQDSFYGHTAAPTAIDILAHERPVTGGADNTVRVWKIATESHLLFHRHTEPVDAVTQLNGHLTVSGSQDGSLMLWSVSNRKPVCVVPKAHESGSWVTALGCLRYSDTVFSGSDDGVIRMWKVEGGRSEKSEDGRKQPKKATELVEIKNHQLPVAGVVNKIVTTHDGRLLLAAVGKEHRLGRWKNCKEAHNGLVIVKLEGSLATAEPVIRNDF